MSINTQFVSFFNVRRGREEKKMAFTLTAGAVRNGVNGLFASFGLASEDGPNTNHNVLTATGEIQLNVDELATFLGMNAVEIQCKFSVDNKIEAQLEEAAEAGKAIRLTWELPAAPGKVSQDKRGNLHYAFTIHIVNCQLVDRWVDPNRLLDQQAMAVALSTPVEKQDPMVLLHQRVAADRMRLAAKKAAEATPSPVPAGTGLDANGDIAL